MAALFCRRIIVSGFVASFICSCAQGPPSSSMDDGKTIKPCVTSCSVSFRPDREIILVDGFQGSFWDLDLLRNRLAGGVAPTHIWRYNNTGFLSLEKAGAALVSELRTFHHPFDLVGVSMGGLVVREAMRQAPNLPLRKAVFLNSPHAGTIIAYLLPLRACREMRPGSVFLRRLNASAWNYPTMVTWCPGDLMVVPGVSARWAKATVAMPCRVPAHAWPLVSPAIQRAVVEFLKN